MGIVNAAKMGIFSVAQHLAGLGDDAFAAA
jgi:hypothetical protein